MESNKSVKPLKKKASSVADSVTLTNAPIDEEYTIRTNTSSLNPMNTNQYYPGDSVNKHKNLEEVNRDLGKEEIRQQNENNALD